MPLPIMDLCARIGISHRQLDRKFSQYVSKTPALYYRDIRLDRARGLVTQTSLSMTEIAYARGLSSQVHLSRAYRDRFGLARVGTVWRGAFPSNTAPGRCIGNEAERPAKSISCPFMISAGLSLP